MNNFVNKKILSQYFYDVLDGIKTFELRKDEDNIQVGDRICLNEWNGECFTGKYITKEVVYILRDCERFGLMKGFCIIGLGKTLDYNL